MSSYRPDPALAGPLYGKDPWPLRFHTHSFNAACFNTLACSIVYNGHQFGTRKRGYDGVAFDSPSGRPISDDWAAEWTAGHLIGLTDGQTFSGPVMVEWTSLDGEHLSVAVNLDEIFSDRKILHHVARNEVKEGWLGAKSIHPESPAILVEVNDRTISVYMRAMVFTEAEQIPGNKYSHFRDDLVLAWKRAY